MGGLQPLRRLGSALAAASLVAVLAGLGGCSLPAEQLGLPGPITGSIEGPPNTNAQPGVPLSDPPHLEAREARFFPGSGTLTGDPSGVSLREIPRGASATDEGVTLNFVDATIPEVAKTVLGDLLAVNYSVSTGVAGKITIRSAKPIPKDELLEVFTGLLRAEGADVVFANGIYQIVPEKSAGSAPRIGRSRRGGVTTEVLRLDYVSAEEMSRILGSVAPKARIERVDDSRNVLVVSGSPGELSSIRETVEVFDVDWMEGMSFALIPVESADPVAITRELDAVFANDRESPIKGMVRFVPNTRLKSVLVITSRPQYLEKAERWVRRIDLVGQANKKQVHVYRVQNRPATELAALLQQVYQSQAEERPTARATLPSGVQSATLTSSADASPTGSTADAPVVTGPEPQPIPSFAPGLQSNPAFAGGADQAAEPVVEAADGATGPGPGPGAEPPSADPEVPDDRRTGIQVVPDEQNNAIIITATADEYRRIRHILSRIDVAPAQVLLEATIAEITLNDQLRFGLRWFFEKRASQLSLTDDLLGAVAPQFPGFSYFLNMPNVQVALNALSDVTDVNVVSSPSLMVLDNKKAVLQIGDEVPIATQSAVSVISPGAPIVNSVSFRNTGVILSITPRIGDNGRVLLEIEQEVSDVVPTTTSNIDSPTIQQRRIKTTVAVGSGESIVLAGFMQDRATRGRQQVPLLGDVPVVGNLFKQKEDDIRRTELLIAITPQIVNDPHQIRGIAAEFRDRLNFRTRPQRRAPPDRREQVDRVIVR